MSDQQQETVQENQPQVEMQATALVEKPYETLAVQKAKQTTIEISDDGFMKATTIEGQFRIAKALFDSKMVPKSYESPSQVLAGMQFAIELGLKPFSGLRNIAIINGSPSIWGELPLALARKTGKLEWMREFLIDKDYSRICYENKNISSKPWAGICQLKRLGEEFVYEAVFTTEEAKDAGLLDKKFTPWHTYPKIMLMRRARSIVLKQSFADALQGVSIAEHDYNYIPNDGEVVNMTHKGDRKIDTAKILNEAHTGLLT